MKTEVSAIGDKENFTTGGKDNKSKKDYFVLFIYVVYSYSFLYAILI